LQEGLGLGLVSDRKPNVSVSSRSRKLRSRLQPWVALCNRADHHIFILSFVLSSFFFFLA